ncbi:MAG: cation diffusion facilitator family transporter [Polyangiales bacterium]
MSQSHRQPEPRAEQARPAAHAHGDQAHDHGHHDHGDHDHGAPAAPGQRPRPHAHGHGHHHHGEGTAAPLLATALVLTLGYSLVEALMGFWTSSLALLADAGHMISDAGALALSLIVARIGQRPRSPNMTYGYRRAEVLGAFTNAATMLGISLFILVEAVRRLQAPPALHGEGLLYTASFGLVLNLVTAFLLSRGHSHDLNVRSALLHVLGDALGSVAAIIAGICATRFAFPLADPLASLAIALVLGVGSLRLLREAADVLMEATPSEVDVAAIERTIVETPGVGGVHDLHVWCLTPRQPMLTAHVVLTQAAHGTDVAKRVGERVHSLHGIDHVTIQPEPPAPELVPLRRKKA